jgi:1-acylglycerone phosphate reductase
MPQKTVLITGCSEGGIGAALAVEFHSRGHRVFATARDTAKMASLAGLGIETLALDVTSGTSISEAAGTVREKLLSSSGNTNAGTRITPKLDILINNAGVNHVMPFSDTKVSDLRRVIDTNVVGPLAITQAFLPLLIRETGKDKSTVVMLGSVNEVFTPPYQTAYTASKAALHAAARTLRIELAPLGVQCVTLMTGSVRTKLFDNAPTKVPEDSLYAAVADKIEQREFLKNAQWVDADKFAKQVADDLLKTRPKLDIWRGGLATVASWLACFGWEGMMVSCLLYLPTYLPPPFYSVACLPEENASESTCRMMMKKRKPDFRANENRILPC